MTDKTEPFDSYDERVGGGKKGILVNDKMEGIWETYDDFLLISKVTYQNGVKEGLCEKYADGRLYATGNYVAGKEDGLWTYYDNGIKTQTISFKQGLFDGPNAGFNPDGQLRYVMNYKNNIPDGYCEDYQNGRLKHLRLYRNGAFTLIYEAYDEQGGVTEKGYINESEYEVREYYQNQRMKEKDIHHPNGNIYEYYDESGLLSGKNYVNEAGEEVVETYKAKHLETRRLRDFSDKRIMPDNSSFLIGKKVS